MGNAGLSVFLVVTIFIAIVAFAQRSPEADPVTLYGVAAALGVVALVLIFLVSVGFLLGTLLRKSLLAVVVMVFIWFPVNMVLSTFSLEEFSPISLTQALPTLLRQPWREVEEAEPEPELATAFQDAIKIFGSFGGAQASAEPEQPSFFEQDYEDFSLQRVLLGYGIPTLLSIVLATVVFSYRDV